MHELVRAEELLREVKSQRFQGPVRLFLRHLEGTQIYLEEVIECFNLITNDTVYKKSKIEFSSQPKMLVCQKCSWGISADDIVLECQNCSSKRLRLSSDDELEILQITAL